MKYKSDIRTESLRALGERIRLVRKEKSLNQEEFANEIGKTRITIGAWERGEQSPGFDDIMLICEKFNCDADYLLGRIETHTHDLQFIRDKTGLYESTVNTLIKAKEVKQQAINNQMQNSNHNNEEWLQAQVVSAEISEYLTNAILLDSTLGEKLLQAAIQVVYNTIGRLSLDSRNYLLPSGTENATNLLPNEYEYTDRINAARFVANQAFNEFFEKLCCDARFIESGFPAGEGQNIIKHGLKSGTLH